MSVPVVAFLGPSLPVKEARRLGVGRVHPPARAGDVWRALALRPRVIALIDGVFESHPSVWHRELLDALAAGIAVFGGASMGALRAVELAPFGMVGVGAVYTAFRDGTLIDDSEVALLHADAEHGFRPLTEPLVNIRHDAARARAAGVLSGPQAREVVRAAEAIFYQERTWARVLQSSKVPAAARERLRRFPREDLKAQDARACLGAAVAFARARAPSPVLVRPLPPFHARQRRAAGAAAPTQAALRRALLVRFARAAGLDAPADLVLQARLVRAGLDTERAHRLASDLGVERLALDHAHRLVNDGPSPAEVAEEARLLARLNT